VNLIAVDVVCRPVPQPTIKIFGFIGEGVSDTSK